MGSSLRFSQAHNASALRDRPGPGLYCQQWSHASNGMWLQAGPCDAYGTGKRSRSALARTRVRLTEL